MGDGSPLLKLVAGRNYSFPKSLVVPCAWTRYSPKSLSLRDAVRNVTHHGDRATTWDQPIDINLEAGYHFPNQPVRSPRSTVSDPLTYWGRDPMPTRAERCVTGRECGYCYEMRSDTGDVPQH